MADPSEAYVEALQWLYSLSARGVRLELDRMQGAVDARGNPERAVPVVHVAGTNGKGSVCAMVERGLRAAGYRTGHFASPHLHRFCERFRIDGEPLAETEVAERLNAIRQAMPGLPPLTFFEVSTLIAFEAFRDHGCDIAVLEVGLGGRLDATNVAADRRVSVITRIARDHAHILGDTLAEIATEKAGILRAGVPAVLGARDPEAVRPIAARAAELAIDGWWMGHDFDGDALPQTEKLPLDAPTQARLRVGTRAHAVGLGLRGDHQAENAAIALATLHRLGDRGFEVPPGAAVAGVRDATWPARLEVLADPEAPGRRVVLDCAHNPDGCAAYAHFLRQRRVPGPRVMVFGAMKDKDYVDMLGPFDGLVDERIYAIPPMPRAPESLSVFDEVRPGRMAKDVAEAVALAREAAGSSGTVIVAGSIFLVQAVRGLILGVDADPPIAM